MGNAADASYLYHPVLNCWGVAEVDAGVVVYQDDIAQEGWDTYEKAQNYDTGVPTKWEHLYPGEMTEWLRSPLETRGFIVPLNEIYNVNVWEFEDFENLQPSKIHWDKVSKDQLIVVKAFGDFGHGMVTWQDKNDRWFFLNYGYDGWGAYGGMFYRIDSQLPPHLKHAGVTVPWATGNAK